MDDRQTDRLVDAELHAFFGRPLPYGFAGADVVAEIAPEGWDQSALLACFHPSVEQRYGEAVQRPRKNESVRKSGGRLANKDQGDENRSSERTLDEKRSEYRA